MRMEGVKCSRFGPPIRFDLVLRDTSVEQSFGGTLQEMSEWVEFELFALQEKIFIGKSYFIKTVYDNNRNF